MAPLSEPRLATGGVGSGELPRLVRRVRERPVADPPAAARALTELSRLTWGSPSAIWSRLERHGGAVAALEAARVECDGRGGRGPAARGEAAATVALPYWDPRYPAGLWRLPDPPPLLFGAGDLSLLARPALAVVGTRRCSGHGRAAARAIALAAGAVGVVVVSGHALGIDAAAHEGALSTGTIAVLGCGLDFPYPRALSALRQRIVARGLVITEFPAGTPPLPRHFPRRNRLIAGLSTALVVVEAPHRSGAQNTVTHALDLGLDVGAVPGPIDRANCAGSNRLLREGATPICEPAHALELLVAEPLTHLGPAGATAASAAPPGPGAPASASSTARRGRPTPVEALRAALAEAPATVDELTERAALDPAAASAALLELELAGTVHRGPGGRFRLASGGGV